MKTVIYNMSKKIIHQVPLEHPKAAYEFVESSLFGICIVCI